MYAVPRVLGQYKGVIFGGRVVYENQEISNPSTAIDGPFNKKPGIPVPAVGVQAVTPPILSNKKRGG